MLFVPAEEHNVPDASDHRHGRRLELSTRVHVKADNQPDEVLMSHDWNGQSVFLRTHHPLPLGARAELSIVIPHATAPVVLKGTVARVVTTDDNAPSRPPGMALHFGPMPHILTSHLAALHEQSTITNPPVPAKAMPPVLVIAGRTGDRLTAVNCLEAAGYDVTETNSVTGLENALTLGPHYRAALIIGDLSRGDLLGLVKGFETRAAEGVDIQIDESKRQPEMLSEPLDCPLIVLPAEASVAAIGEAVAAHVRPASVGLVPVPDGFQIR